MRSRVRFDLQPADANLLACDRERRKRRAFPGAALRLRKMDRLWLRLVAGADWLCRCKVVSREGIEHVRRGRRPTPTCRERRGETRSSEARDGEPRRNRTFNPQIKSWVETSKTLDLLTILTIRVAPRGTVRHIDRTPAGPQHLESVSKPQRARTDPQRPPLRSHRTGVPRRGTDRRTRGPH